MARARAIGPLDSDRKIFEFVRGDFEKLDQEVFSVLGFDLNNDLRVYSEIARGQRDRVAVNPGDILRPVLIEGATSYVVVHNHPSGNVAPSQQDKHLTELLRQATKPYERGLVFLDHLIVGTGGHYYSFADKRSKRG
jgi:DNA repair protein RadC